MLPSFSRAEKSPLRSAIVGTVATIPPAVPPDATDLVQVKPNRKNVRFLPLYTLGIITGPLREPPGLVRLRLARGCPAALAKNWLASTAAVSLSKNALPWKRLVPDLR